MGNYRIISFIFLVLIGCTSSTHSDHVCTDAFNWCENVMNAKRCNAVDFCIQTVWEVHDVRIDSNPLCDDCKDWVQQARNFITNKRTSREIIDSLELSCQLCPYEDGKNKCKQLIEENVNEIFKLLKSEMDPDKICAAIHLCNNPMFSDMFVRHKTIEKKEETQTQKFLPFTCGQCNIIGTHLKNKFLALSADEVLETSLKFCGETSSFSDSCMNIILKNSDDIYDYLHKHITRKNLCQNTCADKNQYSQDSQEEIDLVSSDVSCKLCEQLMLHLREILIANTTEIEFKNLLQGFCSQIPKIEDECISMSEQYYHDIYSFLEDGLDANKTCALIGVCDIEGRVFATPTRPLLSDDFFPSPPIKNVEIIDDENSIVLRNDGKLCTACEYVVNSIHAQIGKSTAENEIIERARKSCKNIRKFEKQCEAVIDTFGNEIVSLIYHGTEARFVCPAMKLCPPNFDLETLEKNVAGEKPTCSFCLFAIQEIKDVIESNNTKTSISSALDKLCDHLSAKLKNQCVQFVQNHSADIIDMMLANFTPQEACVFIHICNKNPPSGKRINLTFSSSESFSIDDASSSREMISNPQCDLCKDLVRILEQRVINIKSKDEVRRKLEESCAHLRRFSKECKTFVDKYSDRIVDLVSKDLEPENVCHELIFCVTADQIDFQDYDAGLDVMLMAFKDDEDEHDQESSSSELGAKSTPGCVLCEFVIQTIEEDLNDKNTDENIKHIVKNVCSKMPSTISKQCNQFVDYYFDMIIALIETSPPAEVCNRIKLCPNKLDVKIQEIKNDIYTCAVCRGVVESIDTIIEDPEVDTNLENLEERICEKFVAGKFKKKCHNLASTYGVAIINLLKNLTESDQICFKFDLCPLSDGGLLFN